METPPIRILQRPCQITAKTDSEIFKPPISVKSLEQREADYAAARRRIMGADTPEQEDETNTTIDTKDTTTANVPTGTVAPRLSSSVTNTTGTTTATPLMSIQATPNLAAGYKSDFRIPVGSVSNFNVGNRNVALSIRQGANIGCVGKPQQQFQPILNGARPIAQQPHHLVTGGSSPSLFSNTSRPAQPMPLFPTQVNAAPNAGLLPTPPGFNFPPQNAAANDSGIGVHRSHSATVSLMQHFGLLQQQYQQPVNGFHQYLAPFAHANLPLNPMSFPVTPLSNSNQNFSNRYTTCPPIDLQLIRFPPGVLDSLLLP